MADDKTLNQCIDEAHDFRAALTKATQSDPENVSATLGIRVSVDEEGRGKGYYLGGFHIDDPFMQPPIDRAFRKALNRCISK